MSVGAHAPVTRARRIKLLPLIKELYILTKDLRIVRLGDVINYAQIDFIKRCERQLATRGQIRICVLKARQIGISTIIEAIAFVLSMMFENFNSLIVSHEDKSAAAILAMTKRYWQTYPWREYYTETYNGQKHLAWTNGSDIDVATAKNVGAGRSRTFQLLHASEVAFWPDPETLMTGLNQSIPTFGLNAIFIESTANGVGNYFHTVCNDAMRGESEYEFVFYPWHEHPEYTAAFIPEEERGKYGTLDVLDDEERFLREQLGVSDDRLLWRRWAIKNRCQGDVDKFHQEYPSTPHEAFISSGRNVFALKDLLAHYEPRRGKRGVLMRKGNRVVFEEDPMGWFTIFAEPSPDRDWGVYVAGGDPTHTTAGDYAVVQVINRRTLEQVAVYRRKVDPINFGKDMQLVGAFYNQALLAPEKTGPGYATVGCVVADGYPNVFSMPNVVKMQGKPTGEDLAGWATNVQTKHLAISHLKRAVSEPVVSIGGQKYGLVIHDKITLLEMRDYVTTEDGGSYTNADGSEYDDGVMALAVAVTVNNIEPPPPAYEEVLEHRLPRREVIREVLTSGHGDLLDNMPHDIPTSEPEPPDEAPWEAWGAPRERLSP